MQEIIIVLLAITMGFTIAVAKRLKKIAKILEDKDKDEKR